MVGAVVQHLKKPSISQPIFIKALTKLGGIVVTCATCVSLNIEHKKFVFFKLIPKSRILNSMSLVFASGFVYACLNNVCHLVLCEEDVCTFSAIYASLCASSTQLPRGKIPTQSMAMDEDGEPITKVAWNTHLSM